MPRARSPAPDTVSALTRGFQVLDTVAAAGKPLGNGEIAALTGIPKATVARLVGSLLALGHLRPAAEHDRYELAPGVVRLAEAFLSGLDLRAAARPHLQALAAATGTSAFLGVRDGDHMLVVEAGRARSAVAVLGADVGTRMALTTSALGRAWLAGVDDTTRAQALGGPPDAAVQAALALARTARPRALAGRVAPGHRRRRRAAAHGARRGGQPELRQPQRRAVQPNACWPRCCRACTPRRRPWPRRSAAWPAWT